MTSEHKMQEGNLPPKSKGNGITHVRPIVTSSDEAERNGRRAKDWSKGHKPVIISRCNKDS